MPIWVVLMLGGLLLDAAGWAGSGPARLAGDVAGLLAAGLVVLGVSVRLGRRGRRIVRPVVSRGEGEALSVVAEPLVQPMLRRATALGVVVGSVRSLGPPGSAQSETCAVTWGSPAALGPDATLEAGSITKVLTGMLLADLILEGTVGPEQDVASLLPLPQLTGVTLAQLATHHSGLPRLPRGVLLRGLAQHPDPYRAFDAERLLASVPPPGPAGRPLYSNLGFAVLGLALARAAGQPYEELVAERLLLPLGMQDSHFRGTPQIRGHDRWGLPVPAWRLAAFAPAGGLRASARDLGRLAAAVLDPPDAPAGRALTLALTAQAEWAADSRIGFGWMIAPDGVVWHNGGTAGASAWLGVDRAARTGVLMLVPSVHRPEFDRAAGRLLRRLTSA
jgi:D-alanyl-D-alanine-carboxypeptidase/D-alanyl-D-alanine-endopeptidase